MFGAPKNAGEAPPDLGKINKIQISFVLKTLFNYIDRLLLKSDHFLKDTRVSLAPWESPYSNHETITI